jgi:hypothetical protein
VSVPECLVVRTLLPDLGRRAVEPLRTSFRSRRRQIGDSSRDTTVAVLEGMDSDEPKMREPCLHYPIALGVSIEPIEESLPVSPPSLLLLLFIFGVNGVKG